MTSKTQLVKGVTMGVLGVLVVVVYGSRLASREPVAEAAALPGLEVSGLAPPTVAYRRLSATQLSAGLYPEEGNWRGKPCLVDLDGDGDLDLVASVRKWSDGRHGDGLFVWFGDGAGSWTPALEGLSRELGYGGAAVHDLDADGDLDLAFAAHNSQPRVYLQLQERTWHESSEGIVTHGICADVALGDLDGDGTPELVSMGFFAETGGLRVFRRGADGWTLFEELLARDVFGAQVRVEDLDGDGRGEIVAVTSLGPKVFTYRDGGLVDLSNGLPEPEVMGSELALVTHDFDADGFAELVIAGMLYDGHPPLRGYRFDGERWQPWGTGFPDEMAFFDLELCQLDGGGAPELAAAGKRGIVLLRQEAPGRFEGLGLIEDTVGTVHLTCGDVNEDGVDEVLFAGNGGLRVLDVSADLEAMP